MMNEINSFLRRTVADARLKFVTVTKVEVSNDLSHAKVFWDTFDPLKRGDAKKAIGGLASKVRGQLAQVLEVRTVPTITFIYDSQYEDEKVITDLLKESQSKASEEE